MRYILLFMIGASICSCTKPKLILETLKAGDCFMIKGDLGVNKIIETGEYSLITYNSYSQNKAIFTKNDDRPEIQQTDCFDIFKDQK